MSGRSPRSSKQPLTLRRRAEAALRTRKHARMPRLAAAPRLLVHELQVHQIELEMQNEELRHAQTELAQSRDRLADLYDFAPVGYLTLDARGRVLEANLTAAKLLGVGRKDLMGRAFARFMQRESQDTFHLRCGRGVAPDGPSRCELELRRERLPSLPVLLECVGVVDPVSGDEQRRIILVDITERRRVETELQKAHAELELKVKERTARLRALTLRLNQAEERVRHQIASFLHDELQQVIAGTRFVLQGLRNERLSRAKRARILQQADSYLQRAHKTTQSLCTELYPEVLRTAGMQEMLGWLRQTMEARFRLKVELDLDLSVEPLPLPLRIFIFQAVRELLFNVAKHARVKRAKVCVRSAGKERMLIEVVDRGVGFNYTENQQNSFGLFSLRERVDHFGGQLEIQSVPGQGACVGLNLPRMAPASMFDHSETSVLTGEPSLGDENRI